MMERFTEIYQLENEGQFLLAQKAWEALYQSDRKDFEVFKRYLFLNWYYLTLVADSDEESQKSYQKRLVALTQEGLELFVDHREFLILLGHICTDFFCYLFEQPIGFGGQLLKRALALYPEDLVVQFMIIEGYAKQVKPNIDALKMMISPRLYQLYPSEGIYDVYFRATLSNR